VVMEYGMVWNCVAPLEAAVLVLVLILVDTVCVVAVGERFVGGVVGLQQGLWKCINFIRSCCQPTTDAAGLVPRERPRACLFGVYERLSATASRPPARRTLARRPAGQAPLVLRAAPWLVARGSWLVVLGAPGCTEGVASTGTRALGFKALLNNKANAMQSAGKSPPVALALALALVGSFALTAHCSGT
jgi:hypothetical protein